MRNLTVSMNISLDGYMAGTRGELDWHFELWSREMGNILNKHLKNADTLLLGRRTYSTFAAYWPYATVDSLFPRDDLAFAEMVNRYTKIVCSATLTLLPWRNSRQIKGDLYQEIIKLKQQEGKDICIYGSGELLAYLIPSGLVDRYILYIHPIILGRGKPLFKNLLDKINLELLDVRQLTTGLIVVDYKTQAYPFCPCAEAGHFVADP
jgi:dihydrofolate reductase